MLNRWMHDQADRIFEEDVAAARASQGTEAYHRYWNSVSPGWRRHLWQSGLHASFKEIAAKADKKANESKAGIEKKEGEANGIRE